MYLTAYHGFCKGPDCLILPTWNHLWFVAYLWVYTVLLYAVVRLFPASVAALRRCAEHWLAGLGVIVVPILYLAAIRTGLVARFPATHALVGDWYNHALYLPVFLVGFALAGARAPWVAIERARWPALAFAVLGWAFLCAYFGTYGDGPAVPPSSLKLFQRVIYGAEQWLAIIAVLGFARRHLVHDSPARRYLTTAIFPVYILHQTVIVAVAHTLKPAHMNPQVEGVLLVFVTLTVCFLGYEGIRRLTLLRPLFGLTRGQRPPRQANPALPTWRVAHPLAEDIN